MQPSWMALQPVSCWRFFRIHDVALACASCVITARIVRMVRHLILLFVVALNEFRRESVIS